MKIKVIVTLKNGVLDPQGKAIQQTLNGMNFSNINDMINNLEIKNLILKNDLKNAKLQIKKMPYSFKKIKYLIALLLPNNFVKKFIQY